ncbi:MAG: peptide deformylase [Gammaproteobacteria bacterium]|nr:peptide deformylase [Gammaproteobacteria bacterium]
MTSSDLKIALGPSQSLRKESRDVSEKEFGEELNKHMDNMLVKMFDLNGVGLSGVQIGDHRRIFVIDAGSGPMKIVNPEILEPSEEKVTYTEGCLSLPGLRLDVERCKYIKLKYFTPFGEAKEEVFPDIHAVIIQHEIDHLNGKTLLDKASWIKRDRYMKKLKKKKRMHKKLLKEMARHGY